MSYFRLKGAYNDVQLQNTPSQYQDLKYPCFTEYPPDSSKSTSQVYSADSIELQEVIIPPVTILKNEYKLLDQTYLFHNDNNNNLLI